MAALRQQVKDYDAFVKSRILPRARKEVRLPEAIYVNRLRNVGVDIAPEQMIERASFDFQEVRDQMQVVANTIARAEHLPSSDYRDVMRELKKTLDPGRPAAALLPRAPEGHRGASSASTSW